MNTTNNKTSLYDSVTKNGKTNIVGEIKKERLDTVSRGKFLTILDELGEVLFTFIHSGREIENGFLKPLIAYYNGIDLIVECPSFKLDEIDTIRFATQTEIEILIKNMSKERYLWDGWNVIRDEANEENEVENVVETPDEEKVFDGFPTEEETIVPSDKKECIIDKAIENKIAHNIKVAKDILDNTLPYYVINENIEHLVRTTDKSLKRDLNNFNYFTNKEDIKEAIRRVKETLMNFQEEIQNRK